MKNGMDIETQERLTHRQLQTMSVLPEPLPEGITRQEAIENYARLVRERLIEEVRAPRGFEQGVVSFDGEVIGATRTYAGGVELARLDRRYSTSKLRRFALGRLRP